MSLLKKCAENALRNCLAIQNDEDFLVIIDEDFEEIGNAFWETGQKIAKNSFLIKIPKTCGDGAEPPEKIAELIQKFPIVVILTTCSMSHTLAIKNALETGVRIATLPGIKRSTLEKTLNADYNKIACLTNLVAEKIENSTQITVTSKSGTDITFLLDEETKVFRDTGIIHKKGELCNLPAGEIFLAPKAGSAKGLIVVDGSMSPIGLLEKPIFITFESGYAVKIEGDFEADLLKKVLEPYGKEALNLAEIGLGTNYKATFTGNIIEDEKSQGTFHFALGNNIVVGGKNNVACHLNGIALKTNFVTDRLQITREGKIISDLN
ncbi:aminopeptidase [bacterium]|nr:aminopeptidase [bacterium]